MKEIQFFVIANFVFWQFKWIPWIISMCQKFSRGKVPSGFRMKFPRSSSKSYNFFELFVIGQTLITCCDRELWVKTSYQIKIFFLEVVFHFLGLMLWLAGGSLPLEAAAHVIFLPPDITRKCQNKNTKFSNFLKILIKMQSRKKFAFSWNVILCSQ